MTLIPNLCGKTYTKLWALTHPTFGVNPLTTEGVHASGVFGTRERAEQWLHRVSRDNKLRSNVEFRIRPVIVIELDEPMEGHRIDENQSVEAA